MVNAVTVGDVILNLFASTMERLVRSQICLFQGFTFMSVFDIDLQSYLREPQTNTCTMPSTLTQNLFLKENVRGPVRECETIVNDILIEMRCEELKFTDLYNEVPIVIKGRNVEDKYCGLGRTRCLGAMCNNYEFEVLSATLRCDGVPFSNYLACT